MSDGLVNFEKIVDRILDPYDTLEMQKNPYDTIEMQKSKRNILDPWWIKLQMQLELIIQNTKSGSFSIYDGIFFFDKLKMLHLSLDDSRCISCLLKAISPRWWIPLYDDCSSNIAHATWIDYS